MRRTSLLLLSILALGAVLALAGCGDDESPTTPPAPDVAGSPDELMGDFVYAYDSLDFESYLEIVSPEVRINLSDETVIQYTLLRDYFDFQQEVRSTERMFSGSDYVRPDGEVVPGIVGIDFNEFTRGADWAVAGDEDPFPGATWAPFHVDIAIAMGTLYWSIRGTIDFYVAEEEITTAYGSWTTWRVVGEVDRTGADKPVEQLTWSRLKVLFY